MTLGIRGRLYAIVVIFAASLLSVAATQVYLEAGTLAPASTTTTSWPNAIARSGRSQ